MPLGEYFRKKRADHIRTHYNEKKKELKKHKEIAERIPDFLKTIKEEYTHFDSSDLEFHGVGKDFVERVNKIINTHDAKDKSFFGTKMDKLTTELIKDPLKHKEHDKKYSEPILNIFSEIRRVIEEHPSEGINIDEFHDIAFSVHRSLKAARDLGELKEELEKLK